MNWVLGRYRCANGSIAVINYRHHGMFLSGTVEGTTKGKDGRLHRWALHRLTAPYTSLEARYETFTGGPRDPGFNLLERNFMRWTPFGLQVVLLIVLIRRGCRPLWFMIAVGCSAGEAIAYDPSNVFAALHVLVGVSRLVWAIETAWMLAAGRRKALAMAGAGLGASAGLATAWGLPMQFNLQDPWMWRFFAYGYASAAVGLGLGALRAWRLGLPRWLQRHGQLTCLHFADRSVANFTPLGKGQGPLWATLMNVHYVQRSVLAVAWILLFWRSALHETNDTEKGERNTENQRGVFEERHWCLP